MSAETNATTERAAAMCDRKHAYQTPQQAWHVLLERKRAARRYKSGRRRDIMAQQVYECPLCGAFHIGKPVDYGIKEQG